jgi:hypothetical protein
MTSGDLDRVALSVLPQGRFGTVVRASAASQLDWGHRLMRAVCPLRSHRSLGPGRLPRRGGARSPAVAEGCAIFVGNMGGTEH